MALLFRVTSMMYCLSAVEPCSTCRIRVVALWLLVQEPVLPKTEALLPESGRADEVGVVVPLSPVTLIVVPGRRAQLVANVRVKVLRIPCSQAVFK